MGAAAQTYFGEPASKLTVPQAAMLAALANLPGYFSPDPNAGAAYTALVARWQYVLNNMVRDGNITLPEFTNMSGCTSPGPRRARRSRRSSPRCTPLRQRLDRPQGLHHDRWCSRSWERPTTTQHQLDTGG